MSGRSQSFSGFLHILAAVAEDEARRISERNRAALQAARGGVKLGSPIASQTAAMARAVRAAYAERANARMRAIIREIQARGVSTLAGVARA